MFSSENYLGEFFEAVIKVFFVQSSFTRLCLSFMTLELLLSSQLEVFCFDCLDHPHDKNFDSIYVEARLEMFKQRQEYANLKFSQKLRFHFSSSFLTKERSWERTITDVRFLPPPSMCCPLATKTTKHTYNLPSL